MYGLIEHLSKFYIMWTEWILNFNLQTEDIDKQGHSREGKG